MVPPRGYRTECSRRKYHGRPAKQVLRTTSIELRPRLEGDDAATNSDRNGLGPILGSKFVHNAFDVNLDGVLGDSQVLTNIAVAVAFGNPSQDLDLALRERVSPDVDSQTFGHNGRKMLASGMYLADDSDQLDRKS